MRHPTDDVLNDYHDDVLAAAERAALEEHLASCAVCDDRCAALGELLDQLHGVPREIAPPEALWTEVLARIDEAPASAPPNPDARPTPASSSSMAVASPSPVSSVPQTAAPPAIVPLERRPRALPRWLLAAAALLLVVVSSAVTMMLIGSGQTSSAEELVATRIASEESLARFAELEAAYLRAAADLVGALESERRSIPPDVAERAEQSLLAIDEAVRETRAALADDPDNAALAELTLAAHRRKLEFLQRVRQWSTES